MPRTYLHMAPHAMLHEGLTGAICVTQTRLAQHVEFDKKCT